MGLHQEVSIITLESNWLPRVTIFTLVYIVKSCKIFLLLKIRTMATNFSPCKGSYVLNQFPSNVMFGMNGFHVSASGAIQGHHGPLVQHYFSYITVASAPIHAFLVFFKPFPHNGTFWCLWETSLLKTLWEKEKLLVMSNFSFSHSVFYPFGLFSAIFVKFEIVVCKLIQFGRVQNFSSGNGLNQ